MSLFALLFLTILLGISVILEGCTDKCEMRSEFVYFEPVYTTVEELRSSIALTEPQPLEEVGKIYIKDNLLYVNEPGEGIHIINNQNPANPLPIKFLKIPGNYELAIKGNTLYADSYVDLVAFDISNPNSITEKGRLMGVFKHYRSMGRDTDVECCVITDWKESTHVFLADTDCNLPLQPWGGVLYESGIAVRMDLAANFSSKAAVAPGSGSVPGVGGSLARFTINGERLYMLDGQDIQVADISSGNAVAGGRSPIAWDIETIFPYKNYLFIGAASGMHIVDVTSPDNPTKLSTYSHVRSCDPVVVDDQYAYVTLRTGNFCAGDINQLEVIDIRNLREPSLISAYPMTNPHGLGIDGKILFVCDGPAGLKTFDATDVTALDRNLLSHYKDIDARDVIPYNDILIMIGQDGLFQYDYSNPKDIRLLSKIPVTNGN